MYEKIGLSIKTDFLVPSTKYQDLGRKLELETSAKLKAESERDLLLQVLAYLGRKVCFESGLVTPESPKFVETLKAENARLREEMAELEAANAQHDSEEHALELALIDMKNRLFAAEAENARLKALTEWRPIETAPKGERVLLWHKDFATPLIGCAIRKNDWLVYVGPHSVCVAPTHWMPLPEPTEVTP